MTRFNSVGRINFTGIRFGLRCGERGEPGLRLRAHPPLANPEPSSEHQKRGVGRGREGTGMRCLRAEGEAAAGGRRRGAGFGEEAAAEEEREGSRPDCLGF